MIFEIVSLSYLEKEKKNGVKISLLFNHFHKCIILFSHIYIYKCIRSVQAVNFN